MKKIKYSMPRKINIGMISIYFVITLMALLYILPLLWLLSGALKTNTELFANPPIWFPKTPQWGNFHTALVQFPFFLYLRNTLTIVAGNIIGVVISCSLVAYAFSCLNWKYRDKVFYLVLLTMMLPFQVTMIPLFVMFNKLGWIGTLNPLIVPAYLAPPFFVFLYRQFFKEIPKDILESAKIDGSSEFTIYLKFVMSLSKPVIVTSMIFTFLNCWNDFIGPLVFLSDNKLYTLSLGIQQIMSQNDPRWTLLLSAGVCMVLPVFILFFVLQKYFIEGITMTGIKG